MEILIRSLVRKMPTWGSWQHPSRAAVPLPQKLSFSLLTRASSLQRPLLTGKSQNISGAGGFGGGGRPPEWVPAYSLQSLDFSDGRQWNDGTTDDGTLFENCDFSERCVRFLKMATYPRGVYDSSVSAFSNQLLEVGLKPL